VEKIGELQQVDMDVKQQLKRMQENIVSNSLYH
jgi:hypothetical protein